ncbi:4-alpha-glucanotransferase [Actinomycetospora endophytica]|uniref:4-alpha-glucanotransferase n=1 Tax=Actinomycetospora endophytica TaxID=2291215 RepID=A0ABS8PIY4_9PSEU|nr:4-alpha-glucanotransferase [Actinomycetospora endophytica]MCD2198216.1 4-alpha-glucanotransferase [Actinomycetospora endophytica]
MPPVQDDLAELAAAYGVATRYRDASERTVEVDSGIVVDVLAALDVDASSPEAVREALRERRGRTELPPTIVAPTDLALPGPGELTLEDGTVRSVTTLDLADLPVGYHRLRCGGAESTVLVAPDRLPEVPRTWGWMVQLYSLHSAESWGCGDLVDLRDLLGAASAQGAGAVLCNPLHALRLDPTVEPSPYSPSSRRFLHPVSLRVQATPAYRAAPAHVRHAVDRLAPGHDTVDVLAESADDGLIDYDAVWDAKRSALALLRPFAGSVGALPGLPGREAPLVPGGFLVAAEEDTEYASTDEALAGEHRAAVAAMDQALREVATWFALAERHGPEWRSWPEGLRSPDGPGIPAAQAELADRIVFHAWCQYLLDVQLAEAHAATFGMPVGLVADLAVGCAPDGADAWALQSFLAPGVHVGAPPDDFNQLGQDWSLPPWRPDRLAEAGYAPLREMLAAVLHHADGVRIDHVAGLWRLWWIPPGRPATEGTYVAYDARAMLAVLTIEATRAGAIVVGEDLGTVEPEVTEGLAARGMLGCAVLWFQRDDAGRLVPPPQWFASTLGTISTHDLPTAVGFLRDEHVRAREAAGLLTDPDGAREQAERDRAELLALLEAQGVLGEDRSEQAIVGAMHTLLARAASRIVLASFTDVLDEVRQPNLPGTTDAYPNWRIPLPLSTEELLRDPRVQATVQALRGR